MRDPLLLANVENQFLQFTGDHHHVATERVHEFARAIGFDLYAAAGTLVCDPANCLAFLYAREFHDAAILAHGVADALVAIAVLHLHAAHVGGNADVVGNKNDDGVGIGIAAVLLDSGELFFVRSAPKKVLHATHEENLKRRHQRGSAGTIKNLGQIRFGQVEFEETKVPQFGRNEMLEDGIAEALAKERFIAHKHIGGTQFARLQLVHEAFGLGKSTHHNAESSREVNCLTVASNAVIRLVTGSSLLRRSNMAGLGRPATGSELSWFKALTGGETGGAKSCDPCLQQLTFLLFH